MNNNYDDNKNNSSENVSGTQNTQNVPNTQDGMNVRSDADNGAANEKLNANNQNAQQNAGASNGDFAAPQQTARPQEQINYQSASHTTEQPFANTSYSRYYGAQNGTNTGSNAQQNGANAQQNSADGQNNAYAQQNSMNAQNGTNGQNCRPEQNSIPSFGYMGGSAPQYSAPAQHERKAKKSGGHGRVIALAVCLCIVCSAVFGIGGAYVTNSIMSSGETTTLTPSSGGSSNGLTYQSVTNANNGTMDDENAMVNAISTAKNSVVEITTETVATSSFFGQYVTEGAGSGVIISTDGYIITCDHVVTGASTVTVKLADGTSYQAAIVGEDSQTDIAVLKIEAKTALTAAVIGDSESLIVGQTAIAIGNPLGSLGGTATSGIISALDREVTIDNQNYNLLQTNAAINPGNSGGGLFNINGELIGIVNAKSSGSSSTTTIEGLGFAIPINNAKKVAEQLISYGYVQGRVMLGVYVYEVTSSTSSYELRQSQYSDLLNYITDYGVYFINYQSGIEGDMMFGDRVVAIDGITVSSKADITNILEDYSVGDKITVTVARLQENGRSTQSKMIEVELTLVENVPAALDNSANG